ncbi:iron chelate uptake ABC transporter family permease subunit, partial [Staphylococcus aureus]|uniref:iron chelate uptake ABC transporter family permease subunit n=1 Tax=Staphylococcus aureus TaxID=1280 RepID=UPI00119F8C61
DAIDELMLLDLRLGGMMISILAGGGVSISGGIVESVRKNGIGEGGILGIKGGGGFGMGLFIGIGKINGEKFVYVVGLISIVGG